MAALATHGGGPATSEDRMPKTTHKIARRSFLSGTALAPLASTFGNAQSWPAHPVTLIIPFPAGGAMDLLGRGVAQELGDKLGQQFVVDNRVGAARRLHDPDGGRRLARAQQIHVRHHAIRSREGTDPDRDPLQAAAYLPGESEGRGEDAAGARRLRPRSPGKLNAGVPGAGTTAHITLAAFMAETGAKMTVVTYRAEPQMLTDLVGGQLDFACTLTTSPGPHVQAGRLRALAVTSATRTQRLPDVPTVEQAGFPGFEATAWFALAAPTGTPADIIEKINATANAFIRSDKGKQELYKLDSLPAGGSPQETKAFIAAEVRKWGPIIKAANIQM
jgi:tripartite-type tricarboxylate transporter receptor subunit TctC